MNVIKSESVVFFDVDDTLVMHLKDDELVHYNETVEVNDPISMGVIRLGVNRPMIRLLQEEAHRGSYVIVWSRGGYEWAHNVLLALYLDDYVDQVMSKPVAYFDDKDIGDWLKYRVYLKPETAYKNIKFNK